MTRPIDATLLPHLQNDLTIFPFLAVALTTGSGSFYYKTNSGNITIGGNVYVADGTLQSISQLTENRDLSQGDIQINFSGLNQTLLNALIANNSNNMPVTLYIGLQDQHNVLIGNPIALGPFLMSRPVIEVDPVGYKITVSVEYYTALLQRKNAMLFTDFQQEARHNGDKFFSLLPILATIQMNWGQKSVTTALGTGGGTGGGGNSRKIGGRLMQQ